MKYSELLELYKKGKLNESDYKKVEADIEKQYLINNYLLDKSTNSGLNDDENTDYQNNSSGAGREDTQIIAIIQNYIRKAFIKVGISISSIILAVILCAIFIFPNVVSMFYYNPTDVVGKDTESGIETNRMSLDLSVYSELFLPGYYRNDVIVDSEGYGKYDITIPQGCSYNGKLTTVNGKLERGKLTLYNKNILVEPARNAFLFPDNVKGVNFLFTDAQTGEVQGPAGTKAEAYKNLEELNEDDFYIAYVSLSDIVDYEKFYEWFDNKELTYGTLWCGVYAENDDGYLVSQNIGFIPNGCGVCLDWDRETYPRLCMLDNNHEYIDDANSSDVMQTHFISLLTYLKNNDDILSIMDNDTTNFDEIIKSVKKDGLRIYGFAIGARKTDIIKLSKDDRVSYIYTSLLN